MLLFIYSSLAGQQVEQFTFGQIYPAINNPGAIAMDGTVQAVGVVRQQWVALSGAPTSQYLALEIPLGMLSGGVGGSFRQTQIGVHKIQKISLGYSYHKTVGENMTIGVGLNAGMLRTEYDGQKLRTPEGEYNGSSSTHNDILIYAMQAGNTYSMDAGVYSKIGGLSVGFSIVNALSGKAEIENLGIKQSQHYIASIGYVYDLNSSIQLDARLNGQWNSGVSQMQSVVMGTWNELYSLGFSMRGFGQGNKESIGGIAGYKLNDHFQLFYSYEYNILPVRSVFDVNHELALTYILNKQIGKGKLPKSIYNPRYF